MRERVGKFDEGDSDALGPLRRSGRAPRERPIRLQYGFFLARDFLF